MHNIIIYGGGSTAGLIADKLIQKNNCNLLFFVDDNPKKLNTSITINESSYPIKSSKEIVKYINDPNIYIYIGSSVAFEEYILFLNKINFPKERINIEYVRDYYYTRINFLKSFATFSYQLKLEGNVAEVGVFKGDFAKIINEYFPDKKLYLFDTFEGFSENDLSINDYGAPNLTVGYMGDTNENIVLSKMKYKDNCEIRKGWFPDTTTQQLELEKFCFVSLDCDLYEPTLAGLEFFYPKLTFNGVILIDDYFIVAWPGVKKAVDKFLHKEQNALALPLGDNRSLIIIKK